MVPSNSEIRSFVTRFEDLPNEVIYEIFDCLDVCQVFEAFFYLNTRFQQLLINSPLPFQVDLTCTSKSIFQHCCIYIIEPNIHRIVSLRLSNPLAIELFLSIFSIDASFIQLESVVLNEIEFKNLEPVLISLSSLPCLYSLTINNNIEVFDSSEIYRLIFRLPFLKSCILSPKCYGGSLSLSISRKEFSPIEYLSINRHCSLNQFIALLSYTPQLRRLSCLSLTETANPIFLLQLIPPNLTHVSLKFWRMSFDVFKLVCSKLFYHLEVLSICTRADDHYLIADRWEQLIRRSMPNLRIFDFQHYWEPVDNDNVEQHTYHILIDRFTSAFWIDRKWFFAHQHFSRRGIRDAVFYSTHPYRRNLYEFHERAHNDACFRCDNGQNFARRVSIDDYRAATNCSLQFPYATELCLWGKGARGNFSFIADLSHMFYFSKLTHFTVQCPDFGLGQLIDLLNQLPNVHSLILYANTSYLSDKQTPSILSHNRIRNVIIRGRCGIEQIYILIALCPRVKCLEVEIEEDQLELIVRFLLLEKTNNIHTDSSRSKPIISKELDFWPRKFFYLFSRTQNKKVTSPDDIPTSVLTQQSCKNSLFSLCLFNPILGMEQRLQRIITREKLLDDFSIGSVFNYLYLWW